jgi:DNA-binding response OmpR family regulator
MRILFVEDEAPLRNFVDQGLTEAGYAVDAFADGEDAWLAASVVPYDAAILDVNLPGIDGFEICRRIRSQADQGPPILFLTARDAITDRVTGLDLGAEDYLVKPFAFAELLARVRSLLRRSPGTAPLLSVADVVLNPMARTVTRSGQPVKLSAKEFAILEYLMRNAGHVVSKAMIAEHVWNFSLEAESNFIEVHIYTLRKKIDAPPHVPLIHTLRGVGYRIDAD